jgi:hypothetical protein
MSDTCEEVKLIDDRLKLFDFVKNFYKISNLNKDNKNFMNDEKYKPIIDIFHEFALDVLKMIVNKTIKCNLTGIYYEDGIKATIENLSWIMQKSRARPNYHKITANARFDQYVVNSLMHCDKDEPYNPDDEDALSGLVMIYAFYYKEKPDDLNNFIETIEPDTFTYCLYPLNMYPHEARNMGLGIEKFVEDSENIKYKFVLYKSVYISKSWFENGF